MTSLNGWHNGERAIQQKLGFHGAVSQSWTNIDGEMPEQHRIFYSTSLPFIPVTTLDSMGRPWSSILSGPGGEIGWVSSETYDQLSMRVRVWDGDPLKANAEYHTKSMDGPQRKMLIAGIGIQFSTRRRNKFAGSVKAIEEQGALFDICTTVNQAIGNCPKYITIRDLVPIVHTKPRVTHQENNLPPSVRLPSGLIAFILSSDTTFIGTSYSASQEDAPRFPSHVGINHRGGRPGFVRVRNDGRTLVLPDYSGNRLMTSLGNIEATALASLTFPSFTDGSILYVTGIAHNLVGALAQAIMPSQDTLTAIEVTGYTFVEDALPVRQRESTVSQMSPYAPPVKLLKEEQAFSTFFNNEDNIHTTLSHIELHTSDLATFTFEYPYRIDIIPGQAAILDFTSFLGASPYRHMAPENPTLVNDDRIRTWTVSRCSSWTSVEDGGSTTFSLTMRLKPGGAITGALFSIADKLAELRPELLTDTRPLGLGAKLIGIAGDFILESPNPHEGAKVAITCDLHEDYVCTNAPRRLLWIAGGIGITPFLAMLSGISSCSTEYEISFLLSTREPDVLLSLLSNAIKAAPHGVKLIVHVFSRTEIFDTSLPASVTLHRHSGRITPSILSNFKGECQDGVYVCGPEAFERVVLQGVVGKVKREGFAY
ncbi:hypothetical protein K503DRAFT_848151 [Rhizopogon vinicolor AM-OR11-026]|uniref:Oxidoreductase FAD/NAD(P)-binding domain-containing protein n=1 Tax=Rhizopogon vinicolor AM-OR11-026 TaxID=1314800 RepID=A0A1B7NAF8_9AGAM|nr:hypothetical protein K503DRAFT_848151 [Rhizopogon vinicolor AM-OR11-026]